jgi:hypothetical protein
MLIGYVLFTLLSNMSPLVLRISISNINAVFLVADNFWKIGKNHEKGLKFQIETKYVFRYEFCQHMVACDGEVFQAHLVLKKEITQ